MYSPFRRLFASSLLQALFLAGLLLTLLLGSPRQVPLAGSPARAQSPPPIQLVQAGVDAYGQGQYESAIALWQQALAAYPADAWSERALVNENLARTYSNLGDTTAALDAWDTAAGAYRQSNNTRQFGRMLTEQAQVYISLGQYQRAAALLCGGEPTVDSPPEGNQASGDTENFLRCPGGSVAIAETTQDIRGQAAAVGSLAETLRLTGNHETAKTLAQSGLQLIQAQQLPQFEAPLMNSLGNLYARLYQIAHRRAEAAELLNKQAIADRLRQEASQNNRAAIGYFTDAIAAAQDQQALYTEVQSHLSLLALYQSQGNKQAMGLSQQRLGQLITQVPARRETAYAAITLAKTYQKGRDFDCGTYQEVADVQPWLEVGRDIAMAIQDNRAASFALGELGHLAECRGNLAAAIQLTNQAQLAASQALESNDSLYLWEWQRGRLHLQQRQENAALAAYGQAIATLESIRTDILTADRELQFDFRDTVEPIYRQYVELQLTAPVEVASTQSIALGRGTRLAGALGTVDSLRLAELQNFFGDDCVLVSSEGARERLLANDSGTVVISSIVLRDRTAVIASFPDGTSQIEWVDSTETLRQTADDFRRSLKRFRLLSAYDKRFAQALYAQLIGKFEASLAANNIDTLVFVHDGFLRNIPMAALHDGEQYLIQRYAVAITPSLGLTATSGDRPKDLRALAVGLSQATRTERGQAFSELKFVPSELASVSAQLPGSKVLLNDDFTVDQLEVALKETRYPILHLATHGQFSTIPEDTFVITGSPPDSETAGELTFGQLEALLRQTSPSADPLDLITLTACETATGDDRATLGLAGVAIRAGARSAIASLWKVNDETAAQLVEAFYENLKDPTLSKAQSLQAAQQAAIAAVPETTNPGYWAPLILVGNWQ